MEEHIKINIFDLDNLSDEEITSILPPYPPKKNNVDFILEETSPKKNSDNIQNIGDFEFSNFHSNSPLTISDYNSNSDHSDSDNELQNIRNERFKHQLEQYHRKSFKKKNFQEIETSLSKYYETDDKFSNKLDILITYIKGQKNIYMHAKYITQNKIHLFMIPTLVISATMAIIAPIIQYYSWSGGLISALNVIVTSCISIMNFMKYESFSEKYMQLTNQYDKLEISLEMTNNKLLFIENEDEKNTLVLNKIVEIEIKINEMKEINNVLIPQDIIKLFPIICSINVFALIRKMENHKRVLIHNFTDVKNEIQYILHKWKNDKYIQDNGCDGRHEKEKNRLIFLYEIKEKIKSELLECKNIYDTIDDIFTKEIKNAERKKTWWLFFSFFKNKKTVIKKESMSPILQKYFQFIFEDS
jgi:hypothetical protein